MKAARDGEENAVRSILKSWEERYQSNEAIVKYKIDKKDKSDYTALHYAVRYGHETVVRLLVNQGAGRNEV